jgi:hypothetical protein
MMGVDALMLSLMELEPRVPDGGWEGRDDDDGGGMLSLMELEPRVPDGGWEGHDDDDGGGMLSLMELEPRYLMGGGREGGRAR